ncbi:MAG: sigma 54-interacting transcriptional regulator [Thermodesulfovibrionales bacterium]
MDVKLDNIENRASSDVAPSDNAAYHENSSADDLLKLQIELAGRDIYKTLDCIVVECLKMEGCRTEGFLGRILQDILRRVRLFEALPPEELAKLASVAENRVLPSGEMICRPMAKGDTYYVIAAGAVRVYRKDREGTDVTLAVRGSGEGFGEISLLTGEPHSVFVETVERTSFIVIPGSAVLCAVFAHPASSRTCSRILAERLAQGYSQIAAVSSTGQAYRHFISEQLMKKDAMLIGSSPAVMNIIAEIETVAGREEPVLVSGEPGTELADIAGLIHEMGRGGRGMLMGMDAKTRRKSDSDTIAASDMQHLGLVQAGILFGRGYNALPFAPDRQLGLLLMAVGGTVVIHNIEYLAPAVQERLSDFIENRGFRAVGEDEVLHSDARIIGTTCADLSAMAEEGSFSRRLYRHISGLALSALPLRRRKRDIGLIVEELIKRSNRELDKNIQGVDGDAYKALMDYDWPGNTEELRVVIRRAVSISTTERLMLDNIFIGPPPITGKYTFNLLKVPAVLRVLTSRFYPRAAYLVSIPFLVLIIGLGFFGPQSPDRNAVLILAWAFWEPLLILSVFFTGRAWCSVCPMGAMGSLVRQAAGFNLKVPMFIKNYGFYFSAAGIAVIFWAAVAFNMPSSPRATAMLVIPITTMSCLAGLLFQRRTWCRYLCPLGSIVGVLSSSAIVEMRSNYGVCNNTCSKHDCYTGNAGREGCPMSEGPFSLQSNRTCVLCATCVKICPNQSPVLNLRLPGYELWTVRKAELGFGVLVISLIGTQLFRGIEGTGFLNIFSNREISTWISSGALVITSVLLAALYTFISGRSTFRGPGAQTERGYLLITYALIPLVLGFEVGFQLERLLTMGGQILPVLGRQFNSTAFFPGLSTPQSVVKTLQVLLVLLGGIGSAWILGKLIQKNDGSTKRKGLPRMLEKWPVLLLAILYIFFFMNAGH